MSHMMRQRQVFQSYMYCIYTPLYCIYVLLVLMLLLSKVFTAGNPQLRSATLFLRCLRCCCLRSHRCRCLSCLRWSSLLMFLYTQLLVLMLVLKCLTPCLENKAKSQLSVWGLFLQKQPKLKQTTTSPVWFCCDNSCVFDYKMLNRPIGGWTVAKLPHLCKMLWIGDITELGTKLETPMTSTGRSASDATEIFSIWRWRWTWWAIFDISLLWHFHVCVCLCKGVGGWGLLCGWGWRKTFYIWLYASFYIVRFSKVLHRVLFVFREGSYILYMGLILIYDRNNHMAMHPPPHHNHNRRHRFIDICK